MDELARLISAFESRDRAHGAAWKLDILMDLGRFDGPKVFALYAAVVADDTESPEVRADALRRLREASLTSTERVGAADAGLRALAADPALTVLVRPDRVVADVGTRSRPPRLPWSIPAAAAPERPATAPPAAHPGPALPVTTTH